MYFSKGKGARARTHRLGFSMVEVVVAMFIIAIVIAGLIPAFVLNIRSNYMAKNYGVANYLAQRKIEQIRSWPQYEDVTVGTTAVMGIETGNAALFTNEVWGDTNCSSCTNTLPGVKETFTVSATVMRNGYDGATKCKGYTFGGTLGTGADDGWANTTPTGSDAGEWPADFAGDCPAGTWRGEDFKIIRVNVTWTDRMSETIRHSIDRQAYIAKF